MAIRRGDVLQRGQDLRGSGVERGQGIGPRRWGRGGRGSGGAGGVVYGDAGRRRAGGGGLDGFGLGALALSPFDDFKHDDCNFGTLMILPSLYLFL